MKETVKYVLTLAVLVVDGVGSFYAGEFRQQSFDIPVTNALLDSLHRLERACGLEVPKEQVTTPLKSQPDSHP